MNEKSVFAVLKQEDVNSYVETKGKFKYLSWGDAINAVLNKYPKTTWEVKRFGENNLPYLKCDNGCFVEVSVTIEDITRSELLPILNFKNAPIKEPNTFEVNTSIKRCLAKALSLHGLGLYIYRGEDFPDAPEELKQELRKLLEENKKYNEGAEKYLQGLTTKQLEESIAKYKG